TLAVPLTGAAKTVVITSADAAVFEQALAGVKRRLGDIPIVRLDSGPPTVALPNAEVVIAIGSKALDLAAQSPPRVRIVAVLVPDSDPVFTRLKDRPVDVVGLYAPPDALLDYLRKLVPRARHVWTIHSPATASIQSKLELAVENAGCSLTATDVSDAGAAVRALRNPPEAVDAFVMLPDPVVRNSAFDQTLLRLAFERRVAVVGASSFDVRAGALYALQLDAQALGEQAAVLANRTVVRTSTSKNEPLAPLGVKFVLNMATARRLGISVPDDLRRQAAEVFGQ
ncbi:MAG TPA: ABC transporter substrate binding protein, partial [Euzebyales bacterium]|nr:ABC transporter substrate binding protein [Euzebyales bacterium]